ncbi:MAG: relaxase/mobilization nuclease domain-containing protein [Cyanobacteria bacterium J06635_10]
MIGKIKKGKGFAGLTKYILEKEGAELICTNLAGETPQDFYRQLGATKQLNCKVRSPVSHISISFPWNEKPIDEELEEIVEETLLGMGFEKNLYFAASHDDCNHFHLHIAASRINIDGECISDWYDKRRLEKVLRNLESRFNLTSVPNSREVDRTAPSTGQKRRMFRENQEFELGLRSEPADKSAVEKIQDVIEDAIQPGMRFAQFIERLKVNGVETSLKLSSEGVVQGISYSTDGVAFAGSKLGRNKQACTLKGLAMRGIKFDLERDALALTRYIGKDDEEHLDVALEAKINKTIRSKDSK